MYDTWAGRVAVRLCEMYRLVYAVTFAAPQRRALGMHGAILPGVGARLRRRFLAA